MFVDAFDGYAVFMRQSVRQPNYDEVREEKIASGLSYEEARDFARSIPHVRAQQAVIRFQGETGGGD